MTDIQRVERFVTPDGEEHRTLQEAEYHISRRRVGEILADHPGIDVESVDAILNALSNDAPRRSLVRAWLHNCDRLLETAKS